ncbi:MAG: chromate transporter [Chloroflexi bacterium]|nr:chromate transporter [Chloroflexota bacterium]
MPSLSDSQPIVSAQGAATADIVMLPPPRLWHLLRAWFSIGTQSFGGGSSTLFLIRRIIVERNGWVSDDEVTKAWAICQIPPGINLLALTTLLGWRLRGALGIIASLAGLLLPSVAITIAFTALYRNVQQLSVVQAALRGIVPATIGLGILMSWQLARPLLAASRAENWQSLVFSLVLLASGGIIVVVWNVPVILVLAAAGLCGTFGYRWLTRHKRTEQTA